MSALDIVIAIIALPCLFYIPGFVAFRAFNVHKIESLKLSLFESVFLQVLASIVITGWIALILAEVGCFSLWLLIVLLDVGSIIVFVIFRSRFNVPKFSKPRLNLNIEAILLIIVIITAILLFFHPSEYVVRGNMDGNAYVCIGVNIANTGTITVNDPFHDYPQAILENIRVFNQFTPSDSSYSALYAPFLHLYPAWIAILYSIGGLGIFLYITPFFSLLGIISILLFCRRLFNNKVGLLAATLLCLNIAQINWAREPSPEMLAQLLILSGAYAFILYKKTGCVFFSILSAVCIGELLLTKLEFIFIVIPIILYLGFIKIEDRKKLYVSFLIPFCILVVHSIIQDCTTSQPYVSNLIIRESYEVFKIVPGFFKIVFNHDFIMNIDWYEDFIRQPSTSFLVVYVLLGLSLVASVGILFIYKLRSIWNFITSEKFTRWLRYCFAVALFTFVIYNWFFRPDYFQPPPNQSLFYYRSHFVGFDAINIVRLGYFLTPLGIWVSTVAIMYLLTKRQRDGLWFFFVPALVYFIFLTIYAGITPPLPWWSRKFIPFVIPMFIILIAYAIHLIRSSFLLGKYLSLLFVVFFVITSLITSAPIIGRAEYSGAINTMNTFATQFNESDLIIFQNERTGILFARPLWFIFNRNAVMLNDVDPIAFEQMLEENRNQSLKFYIITWDSNDFIEKLSTQSHIEVGLREDFSNYTIQYPEYRYTYLDLDIKTGNEIYNLSVYEIKYVN